MTALEVVARDQPCTATHVAEMLDVPRGEALAELTALARQGRVLRGQYQRWALGTVGDTSDATLLAWVGPGWKPAEEVAQWLRERGLTTGAGCHQLARLVREGRLEARSTREGWTRHYEYRRSG